MKYWLKDFDVIENVTLPKLTQAGIENTDQLLDKAAFPQQRIALEQELDIPREELLQWVGLADLVRVKGVGPKLAQLLVQLAEIRGVQDLAQSKPQTLRPLLKAENTKHQIIGRIPSVSELAEYVEEAQELRTRVVYEAFAPMDFKAEVKKIDAHDNQATKDMRRQYTLFYIAAFLVVACCLSGAAFVLSVDSWSTDSDSLSELIHGAEKLWFSFNTLSFLTLIGLLGCFVFGARRLGDLQTLFLKNHVRFRLFDRPLFQHCYIDVDNYLEARSQTRESGANAGPLALSVIALIAVLLIIVFGLDPLQFISLAIPPTILLALFPYLRRIWSFYRGDSEFGPAALQRYLGYRLLYTISIVIWVWFILQVLLPTTFQSHRFIIERWRLPRLTAQLDEITSQVSRLPADTERDIEAQKRFLEKFTPSQMEYVLNLTMLYEKDGTPLESLLLPYVIKVTTQTLILGIVVALILPFIVFRRIWPALLFILVLAFSEGIEYLLTSYTEASFFLPEGSLTALLLILTLFLSNTILFDWFYQEATEKYKQCLVCGQELNATAQYCFRCGSAQPVINNPAQQ